MIKTKFIDYKPGPADNLFINERQIQAKQDQYIIKVKAVGINRAQVLHRLGKYPIKNEVQKNIGLQASGQIIDPVTKQKLFDGIALLSGGSYSQWAVVPKTHVMPLPQGLSINEGAGIPQAWLTAYQLIRLAQLKQGQKVVLYAAASGVGTAAIQICHMLGIIPYGVVSGQQKGKLCQRYGIKKVVFYKQNENWDKELIQQNNEHFDAVLDCVCGNFVHKTVNLLRIDGRWILYGGLSGTKIDFDFGMLLGKRIKVTATTLKTRSKQYKDQLIDAFTKKILPGFASKKNQVVIDQVIETDWNSAEAFIQAHKKMQSNQNAGKIIIAYK